jgi:hypothetical protein
MRPGDSLLRPEMRRNKGVLSSIALEGVNETVLEEKSWFPNRQVHRPSRVDQTTWPRPGDDTYLYHREFEDFRSKSLLDNKLRV